MLWIQGCVARLVSDAACPLSLAGRDRSRRDTLGASAPVDDLGFVDLVARVVGGHQARGVADHTVDIGDGVAATADHVVMVVADAEFVPAWPARRLDATHLPSAGERAKHDVHGLGRAIPEVLADGADDRINARMKCASSKRRKHRQP